MQNVLVYKDGGDLVFDIGRRTFHDSKPMKHWREMGARLGQKWLYKGYHYYGGERSQVVVFDKKRWDASEIAFRKANGFLGIREYKV